MSDRRSDDGAPLYWLAYRREGKPIGVVVIGASSLADARMRAAIGEADTGADFSEGYELNRERASLVPTKQVGRMLTMEEAAKLLQRFGKS
jgi:hypothetical protein